MKVIHPSTPLGTYTIGRLCGFCPKTVARFIDQGLLKGWMAGRERRVKASDLRAFLVKHGMPVPANLRGAT